MLVDIHRMVTLTIRAGTVFECSDCGFTTPVETELEEHSRAWDHETIGEANEPIAEIHKSDNEGSFIQKQCGGVTHDLVEYKCLGCPFQASDKALYSKHLIDVHEIVEIFNNESEAGLSLGEDSGIWDTEMDHVHVEEADVEAKKKALIEQMMQKQLEKGMKKPKKGKMSRSKRARHSRESFG